MDNNINFGNALDRLKTVAQKQLDITDLKIKNGEYIPPKYICTLCEDTGVVENLADTKDNYKRYEHCKCKIKKWNLERLANSGLGYTSNLTFEKFKTKTPMQKFIFTKAEEFIQQTDKSMFFIGGQVGSGKTHLCTAICMHYIDNSKQVKYKTYTDLIRLLKSNVMDVEEYSSIMQPLKDTKILYIDDLFKAQVGKQPTPADVEHIFNLINFRYADPSLITIISSEKSLSQIIAIDEAIGSRIFERSGQFKLEVTLHTDNNYRLQIK